MKIDRRGLTRKKKSDVPMPRKVELSSSSPQATAHLHGRRQWILGTALALGSLALGRDARGQDARPGAGRRILILGDSMIAGAFGLFLERALQEKHGHVVTRHGKSSTGLARPDFYDWQVVGPAKAKTSPADAVVVMFGGNDAQALRMGTTKNAGWIHWGEENWESEYRQRIRSLCDAIAPAPVQIYWVGMPVMRPEKLNARVQLLNQIYRSEMALRSNAAFIDIWDLLADEDGNYSHRLQIGDMRKKTTLRAGDGVHLTVAGAHYLADTVAPIIDRGLSSGI
jgi:hypothetical protein